MTLVTNESQRVENQVSYSAELLANAACLELKTIGPVGNWNYGQGIRKALGEHFFYELRSQFFSVLGINHPIALKTKWFQPDSIASVQPFPSHLTTRYPVLENWSWYIRPKTTKIDTHWFREDSTLKSEFGWAGFRQLNLIQGWIVDLNNEYEYVSTTKHETQVSSSHEAFSLQEQVKIFLSEDVLGINGRLNDWIKQLSFYQWGEWNGLNFIFASDATESELHQSGLAVDIINGKIHAHFCLSMLPEDIHNIMRALSPYQG